MGCVAARCGYDSIILTIETIHAHEQNTTKTTLPKAELTTKNKKKCMSLRRVGACTVQNSRLLCPSQPKEKEKNLTALNFFFFF